MRQKGLLFYFIFFFPFTSEPQKSSSDQKEMEKKNRPTGGTGTV
jgi:hypothetical protein